MPDQLWADYLEQQERATGPRPRSRKAWRVTEPGQTFPKLLCPHRWDCPKRKAMPKKRLCGFEAVDATGYELWRGCPVYKAQEDGDAAS